MSSTTVTPSVTTLLYQAQVTATQAQLDSIPQLQAIAIANYSQQTAQLNVQLAQQQAILAESQAAVAPAS